MGKNKINTKFSKEKSRQNKKNNLHDKELNEYIDQLLRLTTTSNPTNLKLLLDNYKEIDCIINKIKNLENSLSNQLDFKDEERATSDIIKIFLQWIKDNGAEFNNLSISKFDGFDLGLKAETDIKESSILITVPKSLMLTADNIQDGSLKKFIENDQILKNMPNVALAICLLNEKFKGNSFWKPYIDILPKHYSTILYFTLEDFDELKGSPTLEKSLQQIKSIARQYAYFHQIFYKCDDPLSKLMKNHFTYMEYCWAVSTVMTRQNTIPFDNDFYALIPLWDLCNHTNGKISTTYNPELKRSECLALRDFNVNEQLFIFYGARNNAHFFIHNGFVYEENEHDGYWLRLGISTSDLLYEKRSTILNNLSISNSNDFFISNKSIPIDGQLLAFVRIFNMNEEQLDYWLENDKISNLLYNDCALDALLEMKTWNFLLARLRLLLSVYNTTLDEDEKLLLLMNELPRNRLLVVKMRATEKRIIKHTIEYVEQRIKQS